MTPSREQLEKAVQDGMEAANAGDLKNPAYETTEERMHFRAGWMEQMKRNGENMEQKQ